MLGTDKTLVGAAGVGDAPERHRRYGLYVEHLDIVITTSYRDAFNETELSTNVRSYPSRSLSKAFFFFDAIKIFKYVRSKHPIDLVVAQDPFLLGLAGWWLKARYGAKFIISFHGDFWDNPHWLRERLINRYLLWISYFTVPHADAIRAVSEAIKNKVAARIGSARKIAVIPTPVVLERFSLSTGASIERIRNQYGKKRIVLFVGRLTKVKNIPFLLEAFLRVKEAYPRAALVIVGDGPERDSIEALRDQLALREHVFLPGRAEYTSMLDYYSAADFVALSSFSEGLPKVLVEAAAARKALVATNVGGVSELIKEGENGFLVPLGDAAYFAEKMLALLRDEPLRRRMGARSEEIVRERFGDTTSRLIAFWYSVAGMKPSEKSTSKENL